MVDFTYLAAADSQGHGGNVTSPANSTSTHDSPSNSTTTQGGGGKAPRVVLPWKAREQEYPREMAYFLMSVLALFTLIHWSRKIISVFRRGYRPSPPSPPIQNVDGSSAKSTIAWRRLPLAIIASFRVVAFRIPLPIGFGNQLLGSEFFIIAAYLIALFTWSFANTDGLKMNEFDQRVAFMAIAQIPFIVGLVGKNNVISYLTGVSHEKLNVFHRASSRACLILLWIHFFGNYLPGLSPKHDFTNGWMVAGGVGLGGLTLGTVLSIQPIRRWMYEFFLIGHILMMLVFLVGGWYHLAHFRKPTARWVDYYMWPGFLLWGLDRLVRAGRTFWNNTIWRKGDKKYSQGTVEVLSDDTLRLTLKRRITWTPGQHAYVILPSVSTIPTEAHPFTIASAPVSLDGSPNSKENNAVFIIRARGGFTSRLMALARKGPSSVPAFMDGPYGMPPDLSGFSTVVLVAGGSGVAYALPMLENLVSLANKNKTTVQHIVLVWAIRRADHLNWISDALSAAIRVAPSTLTIETRIHATGTAAVIEGTLSAEKSSGSSSPSEEKSSGSSYSIDAPINVLSGRPNIRSILEETISLAQGSVSVDVCGPASLSSSVREALRFDLAGGLGVLKGHAPVTLHVEKFGM